VRPAFMRHCGAEAGCSKRARKCGLEIEIENDRKRTQMLRHQRVSRNGRLVSRTLMSEYLQLKRAYEEKQGRGSSLLAWRARNLLELSVWSLYCTQGRENARRLYEDAGRDTRDVFNAFIKWGTARSQPSDWLDPLANANQALLQRADSEGIDSLEGTYKAVSEAAKECGLADNFSLSYKMLSKFAHPTAMQILAGPEDAKEELQRDLFFSQGCLFFTGAFVALERELNDL